MAALSIQVPYPVFYDRDGQPLDNGNIYIGVANLDPVTNPLQVYYDEALTITASQPLKTSNGYVYRNGTPAQLYVNANDFSITVNDSKNLFVYSFPEGTGLGVGAASIKYDPPFAGAVTSGYTVSDKLSQTVSVRDFGAVGDGVTNDTAAIQAAINAVDSLGGGVVNFVNGKTYLVSALIRLKTNVSLAGNGCTISVNPLNYTGGITQFFGVFSTVNIIARPEPILWRIGTGVISYENIIIDGFTFNINRNGNVLTGGQMDVADINIVRFEDARNCKITNCNFIDAETIANNNGNQVVYFVRSEQCELSSCYAEYTSVVYIAESKNCVVSGNNIPVSVGTSIETVAGQSHTISNNKLGITWWAVSGIGINSNQCQINGNTIDEAPLTGITIGHPTVSGGANYYNLPLTADYSSCNNNYIMSGGTTTVNHGYIGVLVQAASYVSVTENAIFNLRKKVDYLDRAAGVLVQPNTSAEASNLQIQKNRISTANSGISIVRTVATTISENAINDVYGGIVQLSVGDAPKLVIQGNTVTSAIRAVSIFNGYVEVSGNFFSGITGGAFSLAFAIGYFRVENNFLTECGEMFFGTVKSVALIGNVIENAVVTSRAANLDNTSTAGTATINQITVTGNTHPGTTDMLRITNVLGQSTRILETTVPTQFRTTSYNVGTLPTSSAGLSAGDLWNDTGTVKIV